MSDNSEIFYFCPSCFIDPYRENVDIDRSLLALDRGINGVSLCDLVVDEKSLNFTTLFFGRFYCEVYVSPSEIARFIHEETLNRHSMFYNAASGQSVSTVNFVRSSSKGETISIDLDIKEKMTVSLVGERDVMVVGNHIFCIIEGCLSEVDHPALLSLIRSCL